MTQVTDYLDVISLYVFVLFLMLYEDTNPVISQKCRVVWISDVLRIFILVGKSGVRDDLWIVYFIISWLIRTV
jgi:hypothetical protein